MNSILIADDHDLFREGLKTIIGHWHDFQVVGEASNGRKALELARILFPDIILMDISMPIMNGLETTQIIARELPRIKVVILTVSDEDNDLFTAIKYGASGYILKNVHARKLHGLLQDVVQGEVALSSPMASKIMQEYKKGRDSNLIDTEITPLTEKEIQVLELVVQGLTNGEIAQKMYVSEHSVKKYLCNILQKLHLNNRVQVAVYAVREGIVENR